MGSVYVPSTHRKEAMGQIREQIMKLKRRFPETPMMILGDLNKDKEKLAKELARLGIPLEINGTRGNVKTFHQPGKKWTGIDHIGGSRGQEMGIKNSGQPKMGSV